jgi:(E)-4-hydroxy-3-methylbut-2-enyl-diphosphate synthase
MDRKTRAVQVGPLVIGGGAPVSVQTMWKKPLAAASREQTTAGIARLRAMGCELLRFAVPDLESAELLGRLAGDSPLPLVADVHFDHRIALRCLDFPVAKIRINPGNIGTAPQVEDLVRKALDKGVALRVGVNAGSLPRGLESRVGSGVPEAMLAAVEAQLEILERLHFRSTVVSLKSSDVETTIQANLLFAERYDLPLHLGVTEAGPLANGVVKSTLALSRLLGGGVGDTIRVSLSDSPEQEIQAGRAILRHTGIRRLGVDIVSCPTCGRTDFDVTGFLDRIGDYLSSLDKDVTIAVMGCPVNGPGEARSADLGITGSRDRAVIFKKGRIIRRVAADDAVEAFKEEAERL